MLLMEMVMMIIGEFLGCDLVNEFFSGELVIFMC